MGFRDWFKRDVNTSPVAQVSTNAQAPQIVLSFVPLQDFFANETRSMYVKDLVYYVRRGNVALTHCVDQWVNDKKVKIVPHMSAERSGRTVQGKGLVQ